MGSLSSFCGAASAGGDSVQEFREVGELLRADMVLNRIEPAGEAAVDFRNHARAVLRDHGVDDVVEVAVSHEDGRAARRRIHFGIELSREREVAREADEARNGPLESEAAEERNRGIDHPDPSRQGAKNPAAEQPDVCRATGTILHRTFRPLHRTDHTSVGLRLADRSQPDQRISRQGDRREYDGRIEQQRR